MTDSTTLELITIEPVVNLVDVEHPSVELATLQSEVQTPGQNPGTWTNNLPNGLTIDYSTTLDNQNNAQFSATFPADTISRFRFEGKDASGTTLEIGQGDPAPGTTSFTLNPFVGNALVVVIVWTITYANSNIVSYEVPITR